MRPSIIPLFLIALLTPIHGQLLTIPEALSRFGKSLSGGPTLPSGPTPTVNQILAITDLIVRAVLSGPTSYLSDDEMDVYTDYPLQHAVILYQVQESPRPRVSQEPAVTVTMLGGAVTINRLTFTSKHEGLPLIPPGTECLLLLKQVGNRYFIAGTYYGAFRIVNGTLTRLVHREEFAPELNGASASSAEQDLVSRVASMRRQR